MSKTPVFFSFYYNDDAMRLQQIRNMGAIEGQPIVSAQDWEAVKARGKPAVERWIDEQMKYKRCIIVLAGANTYWRPWVQYEIQKAHNDNKKMFGIYIHNLRCPNTGTCARGQNPFAQLQLNAYQKLSDRYPCHDPSSFDTYNEISRNLESWIANAPSRY